MLLASKFKQHYASPTFSSAQAPLLFYLWVEPDKELI